MSGLVLESIPIDGLDATAAPSRDHVLPAMKDGAAVRLSVDQILAVADEYAASIGRVVPFSTFAAAAAYSPKAAPAFIRTEGYFEAGDLGGGLYRAVNAMPAHAGRLSIVLSNGDTKWYEIRPERGALRPQQLACKADGVTDDSSALTALNAVCAAKSWRIEHMFGDCYIGSSVTFTVPVEIDGGRFTRAEGANLTFSRSLRILDAAQVFNITTTGAVLGSAVLHDNAARPEWWGADPTNAAFLSTPALRACIAFLSQRSISGGAARSGRMILNQGWYRTDGSIQIAQRGITVEAENPLSTYLYIQGNVSTFSVLGGASLANAARGTRIKGIQFYHAEAQPNAGIDILFDECNEFWVQDCIFTDYFQAIVLRGCQGSYSKRIEGNSGVSSPLGGGTIQTSSGFIFLRGKTSPSYGTGLTEDTRITDNLCLGVDIEFGLYIDGADTFHLDGNHFAGQKVAVLYIVSTSHNIYNGHSSNNCWEGLNSYSQNTVYIRNNSGGANIMGSLYFSTDQVLNGQTAAVNIGGTGTVGSVSFVNCDIIQAITQGILILNGKHIRFASCNIVDADVSNTGAGTSSYVVIGQLGSGPDDVLITDCQMGQDYVVRIMGYGVRIRGGTRIAVNDNVISGTTLPIFNDGVAAAQLTIRDNVTDASTTVASATTIAPPLGAQVFYCTGNVQIDFVAAGSAARARVWWLRFAGTPTLRHNQGAGGFWLTGGTNSTKTAGSWSQFVYDAANDRHVEIARLVA